MVLILQLTLLVLMTILAVVSLTMMGCVARAVSRRRMLSVAGGVLNDASVGVGVSVLYSGTGDACRVAELLDVGYGRYELVLVVDAQLHPEEFELLIVSYALIGVCHTLDEEISVGGVRGLYRSRKRCFRRLVVVDKAFTKVVDDLDAALAVATYDYVLPVKAEWRLLPNTIGRMAAELGEYTQGTIDMVWSPLATPALLIDRECVVVGGGFSRHPWRAIPSSRRHTIYEPLLRGEPVMSNVERWWSPAWSVSLGLGVVASAALGLWWVCAVMLTMVVVWCSVRVVVPLLWRGEGFVVDGEAVVLFMLHKFNLRNFTIS